MQHHITIKLLKLFQIELQLLNISLSIWFLVFRIQVNTPPDHSTHISESPLMAFNFSLALKICHCNPMNLFSMMTDIRMLLSQIGKEFDIFGIS